MTSRKPYKYPMDNDRKILRAYLDDLNIHDMVDLVFDYDRETLKELERAISDYIARNLEKIDVKNIIADEIGHEKYFEKLKGEMKK